MTKAEFDKRVKLLMAENSKRVNIQPSEQEFYIHINFTQMNYENYSAYLNLLSGCADLSDEELLLRICALQNFTDKLTGRRFIEKETSSKNKKYKPSPFSPSEFRYDNRISEWFDSLYELFYGQHEEEENDNWTYSEFLLKDDIAKNSVPSPFHFRPQQYSLIVFCENDENINRLYNMFLQSREELKITNVYKISEADRKEHDEIDIALNYRDVLILKAHGNENITYFNKGSFVLLYDLPFESERMIKIIETIHKIKRMKKKQGKKGVQMTVVDERGAKSSASFIVCKNSIDEYKVRVFKSYADAIIIKNERYEYILSSVNLKTDLHNFRNALLQAYQKRDERKEDKAKTTELLDRLISTADFESVKNSHANFCLLLEDYGSITLYETFEKLKRHEITEEECKKILERLYNDLYDIDEPTVYFFGEVHKYVENYAMIAYRTYKKIKLGEYSKTEIQELYKNILNDDNNFSAIKKVKELVSKNYSICLIGNTFIPDLVKKALHAQNDLEYDTIDFS